MKFLPTLEDIKHILKACSPKSEWDERALNNMAQFPYSLHFNDKEPEKIK